MGWMPETIRMDGVRSYSTSIISSSPAIRGWRRRLSWASTDLSTAPVTNAAAKNVPIPEPTRSASVQTRSKCRSISAITSWARLCRTLRQVLSICERYDWLIGLPISRLTALAEQGAEFLEINYAPGAMSGASMSHHEGREFGLILEGEFVVELGFESYTLQEGDSIIFESTVPHRLINKSNRPMRAVWVVLSKAS